MKYFAICGFLNKFERLYVDFFHNILILSRKIYDGEAVLIYERQFLIWFLGEIRESVFVGDDFRFPKITFFTFPYGFNPYH